MLFHYRLILINSIKRFSLYLTRSSSTASIHYDPCTGCEIPCTQHVSYPPEILKTIDQSSMINSVEKYRRHLCIGQSHLPSQWPKDITNLSDGYLKELSEIFTKKQNDIGYPIKITSASISSKTSSNHQIADWYLFPDQIKLNNIHINQIEEIFDRLFLKNISLSEFSQDIEYERLSGIWMLICCHQQRDQRCGIIGPILVDEIEKHVRKTNQIDNIHCLKISHIGGHRFAGNIIIYPSGVWYGRVLTCHIPLLIDAYTSSSSTSTNSNEKLKPLLRGYIDTS